MHQLVRKVITSLIFSFTILLTGCSDSVPSEDKTNAQLTVSDVEASAIIKHYADLAYVVLEDSLLTAKALKVAAIKLIKHPSEVALLQAQEAWRNARVPYSQSEVFRFGHIDDDWDRQLNAWPLDEGLLDYIKPGNYRFEDGNVNAIANIIAKDSLMIGTEKIDLSYFTPEVLNRLNEIGGHDVNVATGYHAIEFLLWGQDLNGFKKGAGNRPYTDYSRGLACTHGNCERRGEYLIAVINLLIRDLGLMVEQWRPGASGNYRDRLLSDNVDQGLRKILFGMEALSLNELAGKRMKVALGNSFT